MRGLSWTPNRIVFGIVVAVAAAVVIGALVLGGTSGTRAGEPGDMAPIERFIASELDASNIPGAAVAVVGADGKIEVLGLGDDGTGNAITGDTPFWIGSNTKSMTALATMQLKEAGRIDLDAPVRTYIPPFTVKDPVAGRQITVRQLLTRRVASHAPTELRSTLSSGTKR